MTMLAGLYGRFVSHTWRDRLTADSDVYSLFYARSSAMRWLAEAREGVIGGIWGMNDAEQDAGDGSQPPRVAWFQVSMTEPIPAGQPLPTQAFLACADDVLARVGVIELEAVQLLLPVQGLVDTCLAALFNDVGWFADTDPSARTPVRITLDGGQDPTIHAAAPAMRDWMRNLHQDVFLCDSVSLMDEDDVVLNPGVIDELWLGPAHHRATFHGTLAEWSLDAIGWLAAFLAEAGFRHGIDNPLMLTASRPGASTQHAD